MSFRVEKPDSLRYVDENWRRDLKEISTNLGYSCLTFPKMKQVIFYFQNSFFNLLLVNSNTLFYRVMVKFKLPLKEMDSGFINFQYVDLLLVGKRLKMFFQICKVYSDNLSTSVQYLII